MAPDYCNTGAVAGYIAVPACGAFIEFLSSA